MSVLKKVKGFELMNVSKKYLQQKFSARIISDLPGFIPSELLLRSPVSNAYVSKYDLHVLPCLKK